MRRALRARVVFVWLVGGFGHTFHFCLLMLDVVLDVHLELFFSELKVGSTPKSKSRRVGVCEFDKKAAYLLSGIIWYP